MGEAAVTKPGICGWLNFLGVVSLLLAFPAALLSPGLTAIATFVQCLVGGILFLAAAKAIELLATIVHRLPPPSADGPIPVYRTVGLDEDAPPTDATPPAEAGPKPRDSRPGVFHWEPPKT